MNGVMFGKYRYCTYYTYYILRIRIKNKTMRYMMYMRDVALKSVWKWERLQGRQGRLGEMSGKAAFIVKWYERFLSEPISGIPVRLARPRSNPVMLLLVLGM